jgi:hypothetical protein
MSQIDWLTGMCMASLIFAAASFLHSDKTRKNLWKTQEYVLKLEERLQKLEKRGQKCK